MYSLRKYCRLVAAGNPSILLLLYVPESELVICDPLGRELRARHAIFHSRDAGRRFLGFMRSQRERLLGERGQKNVKRPELVEAYGYDTKYAGHVLRLGYQGVEYLEDGRIALPMPEPARSEVLAVRRGEVTLEALLETVAELEARMIQVIATSQHPEHADMAAVNQFLLHAYTTYWGESSQ